MAKREDSREPTTGRFIKFFAMVYFSLVTNTPETSDEVKAPAAAAAENCPDSIVVPVITDTSTPPPQEVAPNNDNLKSGIRIVQAEREPGNAGVISIPVAVAAIAITTAIAMKVAGVDLDKPGQPEFGQPWLINISLVFVCVSFTGIASGVLLKKYGEFAKVVESLGIVLSSISFCAVVAFYLPDWFKCLPAVCVVIILVSFVISVWKPTPS